MQNADFFLNIHDIPRNMQTGEEGLVLESQHGEAQSTLRVHKDGRILFEYNPRGREQQEIPQITPESTPQKSERNRTGKSRRNRPAQKDLSLEGITLDDLSTFEGRTFGEAMRYFRQTSRVSQEEFGDKSGMSRAGVSLIERGKYSPINSMAAIRKGFGWEEDDPRAKILMDKFQEDMANRQRRPGVDRPRQGAHRDKSLEGVTVDDPSTFNELAFGKTMRYFRQTADFTLQEFAERIGVSASLISRVELGKRPPLNVSTAIQEGFGWEEDDPRAKILLSKWQEDMPKRQSKKQRGQTS